METVEERPPLTKSKQFPLKGPSAGCQERPGPAIQDSYTADVCKSLPGQ